MPSFSGLWDHEHGEPHTLLSNTTGNAHTALAKVFANRIYNRGAVRAVLNSLIGAAPGENATATHKRVEAARNLDANVQGGKRVIETVTHVNRNTTAADAAKLQAALAQKSQPTYAIDKSGNSGGGKLGW